MLTDYKAYFTHVLLPTPTAQKLNKTSQLCSSLNHNLSLIPVHYSNTATPPIYNPVTTPDVREMYIMG